MKVPKDTVVAMLALIKTTISKVTPKEGDTKSAARITLRGIVALATEQGCPFDKKKATVTFKKWQQYVKGYGYEGVLNFIEDRNVLKCWENVGLHGRISMATNVNIDNVVKMEREQAPTRTNESNMYKGRNTITSAEN